MGAGSRAPPRARRGRRSFTTRLAAPPEGGKIDLGTLQLDPTGWLDVAVVDSAGAPIALRSRVRLVRAHQPDARPAWRFLSGGNTRTALAPGGWTGELIVRGRIPLSAIDVEVAEDGDTRVEVPVVQSGWLRVAVTQNGRAVSGAALRLLYDGPHHDAFARRARIGIAADGSDEESGMPGTQNDAVTDADGLLTFRPLPPGDYVVRAGMTEASVSLSEGDTRDITIELGE